MFVVELLWYDLGMIVKSYLDMYLVGNFVLGWEWGNVFFKVGILMN